MLWDGFDASEVVAQIEFDVPARCSKNRRMCRGDGGNWVEMHDLKSPGMRRDM